MRDYSANFRNVGVIGLGEFGSYIASELSRSCDVVGYDSCPVDSRIQHVSISEIAHRDVVILCIPLSAYPDVLGAVREHLSPDTVLMDTCSVKEKAESYVRQILPNHPNVLMTHPLFGPQSAVNGTSGFDLFITRCTGPMAVACLEWLRERLNTKIQRISASEHDQLMARIQALTFFIGRALKHMEITSDALVGTESFGWIQSLACLENSHSDALFDTIQNGNPHAAKIRKSLFTALQEIERSLGAQSK